MVPPDRFRLFAALLSAAALASAPVPAQELRYTRPLQVTEAGWVEVPLDPRVLRRTGAGGGFRLFGPEGEEVEFTRAPVEPPRALRTAEILSPEPGEDGVWIPMAVSPGPRLHDLLVLYADEADGGDTPPPVRLEGRADDGSWQLLAAGIPRMEEGRLSFPYPATELRSLRLYWPRRPGEGGSPRISGAAVVEVPPRSLGLSFSRPECRAAEPSRSPLRTVCRLPVGGAGRYLRRLCVTVAAGGDAGYRLFRAVDGRWEPVAEAAWSVPPEEAPRCAVLDLTLAGEREPLRLELYGGDGDAPAVRRVDAGFAPEVLWFQARRPGVHTLAYGPGTSWSGRAADLAPPAGLEPAVVVPGAEEAAEVPTSSLALPTAAGPAPAVRFESRWRVTAETPEPGGVHRLEVPPAVYPVAKEGLADLRLLIPEAGSRLQVPYVLWRPEEPALAAARRAVRPERGEGGDGASRLAIEPPDGSLPVSALVVSAAPAGGEAWVRGVRFRGAGVGGGDRVEWSCRPRPPLPCRITLPLEARSAGALVVEIDDRGAPRLAAVDLELWRRRDVLLFPWPSDDGPPVLAVGAAELEAPTFELSDRRAELVARPWSEAGLAPPGVEGGRLGAVAITLALLAAAAALVILLHRILAPQAPHRRET